MNLIYNGDCEAALDSLRPVDMIFMDPPDNLGLEYDGYKDSRPDYIAWLTRLITKSAERASVVWVSYYAQHDWALKHALPYFSDFEIRTFVWTFGFGQDRREDCGSGYRPMLRIARKGYPWAAEDIKVPSERQALGDKRAKPGGRVPLDNWEFPRVCGNFPERKRWHKTQHPEALLIRALKLSGALRARFRVVDLFGGTGTTLRAMKALQFKNPDSSCLICEQSAIYCQNIAVENGVDVVKLIPESW